MEPRRRIYLEQLIEIMTGYKPEMALLSPPDQVLYLRRIFELALFSNKVPKESLLDAMVTYDSLNALIAKRAHVYKIADKFGSHLAKTNLDIPCEMLPSKMGSAYFLEFPENITWDIGPKKYARSCVVNIGRFSGEFANQKAEFYHFEDVKEGDIRSFAILIPDYDEKGNYLDSSSHFVFPLRPHKTLSECLAELPNTGKSVAANEVESDLISFAAKCVLYIESGDPDLIPEAGQYSTSKKPKKQRIMARNFCPFDVVNVGYSFHKKHFHTERTMVSGHFRWQPFGPERKQVKLIWIDEHERTFGKKGEYEHR